MRFLTPSDGRTGPRRAHRRPPRPAWLKPVLRSAAGAALVAGMAAGFVQLERSGWIAAQYEALRTGAIAATAEAGLKVADVAVSGRHRTSRDELLAALDVRRNDPILGFDPRSARERLEALPWIKSARVERSLPDVVRVDVVERRPLALWQVDRRLQVIDADGQVIRVPDIRRFRELPIVVGPDAATHARALLDLLAGEPDLAKRMTAAVRVAERRWNVRLDDKIEIRLPAEDMGVAWSRLAAMERSHAMLDRDIVAVDLRLPDRLIVQLAPGAKAGTETGSTGAAGAGKST